MPRAAAGYPPARCALKLKMRSLEAGASVPAGDHQDELSTTKCAVHVSLVPPGQTGEEQVPRQKGVMVLSMRDLGG